MKLINQWLSGTLADTKRLQTIRVIATTEPKCNLTCEHCYWPHDLVRVGEQDWTKQIAFLKEFNVPLFFAGRILNERGAKFLRNVFREEASPYVGIIDNGLTILDYPEFFPRYSSVNISIDGWKEEHDKQRNRAGLFDLAWGTVLAMKDQGIDPIISAAISPITMGNWERFEEVLMEHNVSLSSTPVWNLPETMKRGTAVFSSRELLREAFLKLIQGMPKLVNLYSLDYVEILKDILADYDWSVDEEVGDCLKATLPSRTILVYRPVSLVSVCELSLHWDGIYYVPPTYGKEWAKDDVDELFFERVRAQNEKELSVWSEITTLVKKKGADIYASWSRI